MARLAKRADADFQRERVGAVGLRGIARPPGKEDGVFELWVDGKLEAARTDLNWHGDWQEYAINAVFLVNYWSDGSAKRQARWFDNFVICTAPIGPITAANPPTLARTRTAVEKGWEAEAATDPEGRDVVWQSRALEASAMNLVTDAAQGEFRGSRRVSNHWRHA